MHFRASVRASDGHMRLTKTHAAKGGSGSAAITSERSTRPTASSAEIASASSGVHSCRTDAKASSTSTMGYLLLRVELTASVPATSGGASSGAVACDALGTCGATATALGCCACSCLVASNCAI